VLANLPTDWGEGAFREYFFQGGFGRFVGFWAACCQALFAYIGVEIVGIAANEVERPRETVPRIVRHVSSRIIFLYVGAIFVLGLNVSVNDPVLASNAKKSYASPFVLMAERAGISGMRHVINAIGLIAALSLCNTRLYVCVSSPFYNLT